MVEASDAHKVVNRIFLWVGLHTLMVIINDVWNLGFMFFFILSMYLFWLLLWIVQISKYF